MKIVTICGSLKFQKEMMVTAQKLALKGICVFTPVYPVIHNIELTQDQLDLLKKEHFKKIELSDYIYVVDKDGYIGESTKLEIDYAKSLSKNVVYYSESDL